MVRRRPVCGITASQLPRARRPRTNGKVACRQPRAYGTQASRLRESNLPSAAGEINGTQASRLRDNSQPSAAGETPAYQLRTTTALQTFDELDFAGFVAELKKQEIRLSLSQQDEWEPYFNDYNTACNTLKEQISETDKEIDTRVFDLYGLTPEERQTVLNT